VNPTPPPLPPGRAVALPGRGETFIRELDHAAGPTILLLHGWTASADLNWFQVYETVGRLGRVIALDHRAHGRGVYSEDPFTLEDAADDAAALLDALGIGSVIAVGYSMGGPIASLLRHRHPAKVDGLVLCATALEWRATLRERLVWRLLSSAQVLFKLGPPRFALERFMREAIKACPEIEGVRGWLLGELRRGDPIGVHQAGVALGRYDARPWAPSLDVPAAVVITSRDRLVRPKKQRQLAHALREAHVVALAGDHDAALVQPVLFRAALREAIDWVAAAAASGHRDFPPQASAMCPEPSQG
jgi:3-oxoadipate enol-lactonase